MKLCRIPFVLTEMLKITGKVQTKSLRDVFNYFFYLDALLAFRPLFLRAFSNHNAVYDH